MLRKIGILIENTPRRMTMPGGTGTFAVWVLFANVRCGLL